MFWGKRPTLEAVQGHKRVTVCGMRFVIRRVSVLDFPDGRFPQFFSSDPRPKLDANSAAHPSVIKKNMEAMMGVVRAGVVDPDLATAGFTVEDLFRDAEVGVKLYWEIITHSVCRFRGVKGLFLYLGQRLLLWALWRRSLGNGPLMWPSSPENSPSSNGNLSTSLSSVS